MGAAGLVADAGGGGGEVGWGFGLGLGLDLRRRGFGDSGSSVMIAIVGVSEECESETMAVCMYSNREVKWKKQALQEKWSLCKGEIQSFRRGVKC